MNTVSNEYDPYFTILPVEMNVRENTAQNKIKNGNNAIIKGEKSHVFICEPAA